MNVSPQADAAFMTALEREDPARYQNLIRNMQRAAARQQRGAGVCQNPKCSNDLLQFRAGTLFCSEGCKKQVQRVLDREKAA